MSSARRSFDIAASAVSNSVDLPTPGSPPTSTSDAGTRPPPSTRSSSATPVAMRSASSAWTSTRRSTRCESAAGPILERVACSSTRVPKAPQPGQRPNHRPETVPHSVHACWTAAAFATRPGYAAAPTAIATTSRNLRDGDVGVADVAAELVEAPLRHVRADQVHLRARVVRHPWDDLGHQVPVERLVAGEPRLAEQRGAAVEARIEIR